jgi:phosphorylcholine metabolism protein LicD
MPQENILIKNEQKQKSEFLEVFSNLCNKNNIKPIIMSSSLIGWYFNGEILPWETNINICLIGKSIEYFINLEYEDDNYKLIKNDSHKINAKFINKKNNNVINIKFLYLSTGEHFESKIFKYMNIIQNSQNPFMKSNYESKLKHIVNSYNVNGNINNTAFVNCKTPNYYNIKHIIPLRENIFEGCEIYLPNNIDECLLQEFGNQTFKPKYKNWIFSSKNKKWVNYNDMSFKNK